MFARCVEGRHSHEFIQALGAMEKLCFLCDFGVIFLPGGTPGASRAPLGAQVGPSDLTDDPFVLSKSPPKDPKVTSETT